MSGFYFGKGSRRHLVGVHPDLVLVAGVALSRSAVDAAVIDGSRTVAQQEENVRRGVSRTMDSRHLPTLVEGGGPAVELAHAIDLVPYVAGRGPVFTDHTDEDLALFEQLHEAMVAAAAALKIPVENGFDLWRWDRPHWQLPGSLYPVHQVNLHDDVRRNTEHGRRH